MIKPEIKRPVRCDMSTNDAKAGGDATPTSQPGQHESHRPDTGPVPALLGDGAHSPALTPPIHDTTRGGPGCSPRPPDRGEGLRAPHTTIEQVLQLAEPTAPRRHPTVSIAAFTALRQEETHSRGRSCDRSGRSQRGIDLACSWRNRAQAVTWSGSPDGSRPPARSTRTDAVAMKPTVSDRRIGWVAS